jgi:proline dehydrogenase
MSLLDRVLVTSLPLVPKPVVGLVAQRYVAGATAADALAAVRKLGHEGAASTLDILGESVKSSERATEFTRQYIALLGEVKAAGLDSTVSVKLSMLGLALSRDLGAANFQAVAGAARGQGIQVTIDMEDHTTTDDTLEIYRQTRQEHGGVGAVLQAYLRRTLDDIDALPGPPDTGAALPGALAASDGPPHIRLCKGIYVEPERIAYKGFQAVRDNFMRCLVRLLDRGAYVGIATHDQWLLDKATAEVKRRGLQPDEYEFQMLLGVTPERRKRLIQAGHRVRVYVPYGEEWYAYSIRRLRENPSIARHVIKAMLHLG